MFVKAARLSTKAIFPLFKFHLDGENLNIGVAGTAFFISREGHFVTAAHIFDGATPSDIFKYWGRLPDQVVNPNQNVTEITRDDGNDLLIGKVPNPESFRPLSLVDYLPPIGKSVCIAGYPLSEIGVGPGNVMQLGGVRRYFQPSFILDHGIYNSTSASGITRLNEGFLARDVGLFGMSGGPILDQHGYVIGMQGSVISRLSTNGTQTIPVHNAGAVKTELIIKLAKNNGIPIDVKM